jgi:predicted TIM-barrel fold metal-dependent hydrolase
MTFASFQSGDHVGSWIIDADAHLTESPDVWSSRVPSKYADQIPRMVRTDDGRDIWVLDGVNISVVGATATAGWDGFPPDLPPTLADCHPGAYDAAARLQYMDQLGIWAQVLYPNVAGFGSQRFLDIKDRELKLLCVRAYNDFLRDWASADPKRLVTIMSLPFWDVEASVAEVERCAGLGFRGILFTGEPQRFGLPTLGNPHWDPLWSSAQAAGLPVHFHVGSGEDSPTGVTPERIATTGRDGTIAYLAASMVLKNGIQCADLICSGVLVRFPKLKFVSVESAIGWVPTVLEQTDYIYQAYSGSDENRPSELFRRQVYCTYWFERAAPRQLLGDIPVDNVMFETDYPHPSCLYGDEVAQAIEVGLARIDEKARHKIVWGNAAALYNIGQPDRARDVVAAL